MIAIKGDNYNKNNHKKKQRMIININLQRAMEQSLILYRYIGKLDNFIAPKVVSHFGSSNTIFIDYSIQK